MKTAAVRTGVCGSMRESRNRPTTVMAVPAIGYMR